MAGSIGFRHTYGVAEYAALTDFACHCLVSIAAYHGRLRDFAFYIVGDGFSRRDITADVLARAEKGKPQ